MDLYINKKIISKENIKAQMSIFISLESKNQIWKKTDMENN